MTYAEMFPDKIERMILDGTNLVEYDLSPISIG